MLSKPYLTNSRAWTAFWISVHETPHEVIEIQSMFNNLTFTNYLYIYPWVGGRTFGYVSKMQIPADPQHFYQIAGEVVSKCKSVAEQHGCSFFQFDLEHIDHIQFEERLFGDQLNTKKIALKKARKSLQYHHTIRKSCHELQPQTGYDNKSLQLFYDINKSWFLGTSSKMRRYTRKALKSNLSVKIGKTDILPDFFKLLQQTSKRQAFNTHSNDYYRKLAALPSSIIVVVYDGSEPVSTWFGISDSDTMYYLYGGNTSEGLAVGASYLTQLTALKIIADRKTAYYDLGGYDKDKGYGLFKEMFHGKVITFPGDWVIPLKRDFGIFNMLLTIRDFFK